MMVVIGPVLTAAAASSCLLTILSGNVFACANDLPVFIGGGAPFVARIITHLVGGIKCEPQPPPRPPPRPTNKPHTRPGVCDESGGAHTLGMVRQPFLRPA